MLFSTNESIPILQWHAWWGGLGVVGVLLLLGLALAPRLRGWSWGDAWAIRAAAGLGATAVVILGAGQVDGCLFRIPWTIPALAGWLTLAVSGVAAWRRRCIDLISTIPEPPSRPAGWIGGLGWGLVALVLVADLGPAFCPPSNYDVLEYHQGIIPHIFELGRVRPIPHIFYTAQPIATEMLYTLAAIFEGTPWGYGPGVMQWLLIVLGTVLLAGGLRVLSIPRPWRPWLVLLFLTHPIAAMLQLDRLTDWIGVVLLAGGIRVAAGALAQDSADRSPSGWWRTAVLLGLLAGGAVGAKWTHVGTVAIPLIFMAFVVEHDNREEKRSLGRGLAASALCGGVALALWLPWGVWLAAMQGDPFAPFLADRFPSASWNARNLAFLMETHGPLSPLSIDYWTNLAARLTHQLPGVPVIALALVLTAGATLMAWARRKQDPSWKPSCSYASARHLIASLALSICIALLLWGQLRHAADRFTAPLLAGSVVLLGWSLVVLADALDRRPVRSPQPLRLVVILLLAAASLPGLWWTARVHREGSFAITALGRHDRATHWKRIMGATAHLFEAAESLPEGSRILALSEARRWPFSRSIALASVFDDTPLTPALDGADDAETVRRRLVEQGYTHLLVNEFEQLRILRMHPPPSLIADERFQELMRMEDRARRDPLLIRFYGIRTLFPTAPPNDERLKLCREFLDLIKPRASWIEGAPGGTPTMWIAPLVEP